MKYDAVVVGAGFAGSVLAERLATEAGLRVLVCDRRGHIGGNAYDELDANGVLCHRYGPHIFHTNAEPVRQYLSRFTEWRPYEHRVRAAVHGRLLPVPINRTTLNGLYGLDLAPGAEVDAFLAARAEERAPFRTSEDVVVGTVGRDLYETFFLGYTRKQWGVDPSALDAGVCGRIAVRNDDDDRYFQDRFQAMPAEGYAAMFARILDHPRIDVALGTAYAAIAPRVSSRLLVWTGPIDGYFGYRFGKLPYRSLRFEYVTRPTPGSTLLQPVAQVNYPDEQVPFTRVTEMRHLTGQAHDLSTLAYEYPVAEGEPYYPVPRPESRLLYRRYAALADRLDDVVFAGRLARYQYLNMDQVVAQALATFDRLRPGLGLEARRAA